MPEVEKNLEVWDSSYDWTLQGEEWSEPWGNSEAQWFGSILPRLHRFLPVNNILEIAPGHGRWTNYLRNYCNNLSLVDLSPTCIISCKERFKEQKNITYHVNDGKSLSMIPDNSVDLIFSFDSLVHAEIDAIETYLSQFKQKMTKNGVAFIHHSNLSEYSKYFSFTEKFNVRIKNRLITASILDNRNWRAFSVSAKKFEMNCEKYSLNCTSQEIINWRSSRLIDCISIITSKDSIWSKPNTIYKNNNFMKEASLIKELSNIYSGSR